MTSKFRYCLLCKKKETQDQCKYGPSIWKMGSIDEGVLIESRKRDKAEALFFAATLAATGSQSPQEFVKMGHIQGPGVELMRKMMEKRGKATVSGLDNQRVAHSARNRRVKKRPPILSTIGKVPGIAEGRIHFHSLRYPLKSGWTPREKMMAKMKSLESRVFGKSPETESVDRYKKLLSAYKAQSQAKPPSKTERHVYRLEDYGINVGRDRREGKNSQSRLLPRVKELPGNAARRRIYQMNLGRVPKSLGEGIDKNTLVMLMAKKIDEKKRKNYLLNSGYIGESKTPAWARNEGKDLEKGGLNKKGIASYRRENPGSKLSMAVTTDPSELKKGSKKWKRRKSFCSRSAGQMKMWPEAAKDPNSRLRLARRKWNC